MHHLVILSGLPGCGKSTFVEEHDLTPYTLSPDAIRLQMSGPVLNHQGEIRINQTVSRAAWKTFHRYLEERMQRGEFVVLDATHTTERYFSTYKKLAERYRYRLLVVDFSDVDLETCWVRNVARAEYKRVPREVLEQMQTQLQALTLPKRFEVVKPADFSLYKYFANQWQDFNEYVRIHHIGDLQGCYTPLPEFLQQVYRGRDPETDQLLNPEDLYIFLGDLLDRGPEDAEVLRYMLGIYQRPNVVILEGNHEKHFWDWANNRATVKHFARSTQPKLEAAGISKKATRALYRATRQVCLYRYEDKEVLLTHGGLSTLPKHLALVSSKELIKGVGKYEESLEMAAGWNETTSTNQYLGHGHHNSPEAPVWTGRVFNLEGKVEFNGHLRVVTLDKTGFVTHEVPFIQSGSIAAGINPETLPKTGVSEFLDELRSNPLVREQTYFHEGQPISSFNFKRKVFYDRLWNAQTMRARGLFLNTASGEIVIRSYDKFFNYGERRETQNGLENYFTYPVRVWGKENGYLGLLGYDPASDTLVYASKSSLTSDFAQKFQQMLEKQLSEEAREKLKETLRREEIALVFEVVDPDWDPHVIDYEAPSLFLLDAVERKPEFAVRSPDWLQSLATEFALPLKKEVLSPLTTAAEVQTVLARLQAPVDLLAQETTLEYTEGVVLEDGRHWLKVKGYYYSQWRRMRTYLEILESESEREPKWGNISPTLKPFLHWYETNNRRLAKDGLLKLRADYLATL